jgi:hypothetical protein
MEQFVAADSSSDDETPLNNSTRHMRKKLRDRSDPMLLEDFT